MTDKPRDRSSRSFSFTYRSEGNDLPVSLWLAATSLIATIFFGLQEIGSFDSP